MTDYAGEALSTISVGRTGRRVGWRVRMTETIVAIIALLGGVSQAAAQSYSVTILGLDQVAFQENRTLGPARAINDSGQVAGSILVGIGPLNSPVYHAAVFDGATTRDLNPQALCPEKDVAEAALSSTGVAINGRGHVLVAAAFDCVRSARTFLYDGTLMREIVGPDASLGGRFWGTALNDEGQVVGQAEVRNASGQWEVHAAFFDGATTRTLGTLGGTSSLATAINTTGQVVGWSCTTPTACNERAFLYDGTTMRDLGTVGGSYSRALFINSEGHVAGVSGTLSGAEHAFLYDGITMRDLGTLGGNLSGPNGLNDAGQVAGVAYTGSCCEHAFLYDGMAMRDLGTLGGARSHAHAINSVGHVVGYADTDSSTSAFHYDGSTMRDLNDHILDAPAGMHLDRAYFIAGTGSIVATSPADDAPFGRRWVLLRPTSAPPDDPVAPQVGSIVVNIDPVPAGTAVTFSASFTDGNAADTHTGLWTWGDGTSSPAAVTENGGSGTAGGSHTYSSAGIYMVTLTVTDSTGLSGSISREVVVADPPAAPQVGPISEIDPVAVGAMITLGAAFTDANVADTHTALWTWGDGTSSAGVVVESAGSGTVQGTHTYAAAGFYSVTLTVTDSTGRTGSVTRALVVYDPLQDGLWGSGLLSSPPGAYRPDPAWSGSSFFWVAARYVPGTSVPVGWVDFEFRDTRRNPAPAFQFSGTGIDWLVVTGARVRLQGSGTLNGVEGYRYMISAVDADLNGMRNQDRFRIRISYTDPLSNQQVVIYDNHLDPATEGTLLEGSLLGRFGEIDLEPNWPARLRQ